MALGGLCTLEFNPVRKVGLAVALLCLLLPVVDASPDPAGQEQPAPGIERLVERVQQHLRQIADLEARFVQRRLTRFGSVIVEREGKLYIQPPGRMRWEYAQPPDLWVQVFQTGESEASELPIMYLAGKGDLLRDFEISEMIWGPKLAPGNIQLSMQPRREDASFTMLVLEVEPMSATIERLVQIDRLNNVIDYQFHDIEYDVGLPENLFEFEIPPDADVIHIGG